MKKAIAFVSAMMLAASMAACGSQSSDSSASASSDASKASTSEASSAAEASSASSADDTADADADGKVYHIGVCQLVQHEALDAATEGFIDAVKEGLGEDNVEVDVQNASGDSATCATIVNTFVSNDVDLILANATASLQAAAAATNEIPILGTSITDYATALDIDDWTGVTGTNISGTADLAPLDEQAAMLNELFPDAKNVGILYCSAEANSAYQATTITGYLEDLGYTCTNYTFADSNDIASVVTNAAADCDVIYVPTDNTAASNTEVINNVCLPAGVPIIAGEQGICSGCGVATLSISYYEIGQKAGEMAVDILKNGADISEMPVEYAANVTKQYVASRCEELGVTVPSDYEAIEE